MWLMATMWNRVLWKSVLVWGKPLLQALMRTAIFELTDAFLMATKASQIFLCSHVLVRLQCMLCS